MTESGSDHKKAVSEMYLSVILRLADMEMEGEGLKKRIQKLERWPWEENELRKQLEDMLRANKEETSSSVDLMDILHLAQESKIFLLDIQNGTGPAGRDLAPNDRSWDRFILQSMGRSLHATSHSGQIIHWNPMAEQLFGYNAEEALGKSDVELLCSEYMQDSAIAIAARVWMGDSWTGQFPLRKQTGEVFMAIISCSPLTDDSDRIMGIVTISIPLAANGCGDPPIVTHNSIYMEHVQSHASAEAPKADSGLKGKSESEDMQMLQLQQNPCGFTARDVKYAWKLTRDRNLWLPWPDWASRSTHMIKARLGTEGSGNGGSMAWSKWTDEMFWKTTFHENSLESQPRLDPSSSSGNGSGSNHFGVERGSAAEFVELLRNGISWREIELGQKIGQGSCGSVYHGIWLGSDVAVKVFPQKAENTKLFEDFSREVAIMRRLSHPNVLLFMGVVTEPEHLSIVTEFLPRGSLYRLLHHKTQELNLNRRLQMALDVALGMNFLHHRKPPIIHRDLKSSNLLVGRNWMVKVGDFGLSRLKTSAFLRRKCDTGTAQWMAPEVLRNEPFTEKSDVFSFGVILWELATKQIPWLEYNFLEVVGSVGIMDRRLEIPENTDPDWVKLIQACWSSDPRLRPSFDNLVVSLKAMQNAKAPSTDLNIPAQDTVFL